MNTKRKKRPRSSRKPSRILRTLWIAFLCCAFLFSACTALLYFARYDGAFDASISRPGAFAGQKVLFLVPHEDDELAMAGAVIRLYVNGGADVTVAFTTNGDDGFDPNQRVKEAARGLRALGVSGDKLLFLGYGNNWTLEPYRHLYHAPGDAVVASKIGRTQTYGAGGYTDFHSTIFSEPATYTRDHYRQDLRYLLKTLAPDTIFCIDLDSHPDHCTVSLLFEEVLGEMLRSNAGYRPTVYKGYAYSIAWYGKADFYGDYLPSMLPPDPANVNDTRFLLDTPNYDWAARVRFPASRDTLSYTLRSNRLFAALRAHGSQDARFRAGNIINGDTVFFERRTDSLLSNDGVTLAASSGNPACLNDFKLVDTSNLYDYPMRFDKGCWQPDTSDSARSVTVTFPTRVQISSVSLYDYYEPDSNITGGTLQFSDGSTVAVGPLQPNGVETRVAFPERAVSSLTFTITSSTGNAPGLTELAAYGPEPKPSATPAFVKLMLDNEAQDFIYRYPASRGSEVPLAVYSYPDTDAEITLSVVSGDGSVMLDGNTLRVPANAASGSYVVRAERADQPEIYDEIEVIVGNSLEMKLLSVLGAYERLLDRAEGKLLSLLRG